MQRSFGVRQSDQLVRRPSDQHGERPVRADDASGQGHGGHSDRRAVEGCPEALDVLKQYKVVPSPFAPPILGDTKGILGAIVNGTATNWPGGAYDPETHTAFLPTGNTPGVDIITGTFQPHNGLYGIDMVGTSTGSTLGCSAWCWCRCRRNSGSRRCGLA